MTDSRLNPKVTVGKADLCIYAAESPKGSGTGSTMYSETGDEVEGEGRGLKADSTKVISVAVRSLHLFFYSTPLSPCPPLSQQKTRGVFSAERKTEDVCIEMSAQLNIRVSHQKSRVIKWIYAC